MHITITGRLGSGKSTVAKLIVENHGYTYYSTGNIMRELAAEAAFEVNIELACGGGGGIACKVGPGAVQVFIESRVGCFPEQVAGVDASPVDAAAFTVEEESAALHAPDAASLFLIAILAGINHKAIAG